MVQKAAKFLSLFLIISFFFPVYNVFADGGDRLTVTTEIGFENKIKQNQGFPLTVTIANHGEDISGELVVTTTTGWNSNVGNVVVPVDIPANSEKNVSFSLPGLSDSYNYGSQPMEHIRFYEGGWQNGKQVKVGGQTQLNPKRYSEEDVLIGLFTDHPDAFHFLKTVKNVQGSTYTTVPVETAEVPSDSVGLSMFTALIVDQDTMSGLTDEQQQAVKSWIAGGGRLIVGGDPGVQQKFGQLTSLLPMENDIKADTLSTAFFNKKDVREYPVDTIEFVTGTLAENARVLQKTSDDHPVVVERSFGKGTVIQLAFSPGAQTFADWDGAASYWSEAVDPAVQNNYGYYYESVYDQLSWSLSSATNMFPSSFLPFSALVIVFIVYLLFIFPALYFVLRKIDKREHSWWILPAVSLLVCIGIFGFGGKDRIAQPQLNEVTLLQLDEEGTGQGYGSVALLSNRSGNYHLNIASDNFAAFPISTNSYTYNETEADTGIRPQGEQLDVLFKNMEYWSIRNVSGPISAMPIGNFTADLQLKDKKVTGTITNNTELSFDDLVIMSGRQEFSLGSAEPGETIDVSFALSGSIVTAPSGTYPTYTQVNDIDKRRKEEVTWSLNELDMFTRGKAALVGYTDDQILQVSLENKDALVSRTNVIVQSLDIQSIVDGPFTLETVDLSPYAYMLDGQGYLDSEDLERGGRKVYASAGVFEFSFTVPEEFLGEDIELTELAIEIRNPESFEYEIWNQEEESYELLDDSNTLDQPEKYVNEYGELLIRVTKDDDMPEDLPAPELSLKGEQTHD
ncbi:hypothetical protein SAMN05421736_101468 [Evansella caseinilytica]|uniref:Uncharacterized protein n=1 Tax=Evansella caseinilytica TaxID=1503961 RepID=A0A1H3HER3_9BACI|nr:hypothetical protein [Evansella caseinilytica]SDY13715.1 hypothetical protein SAMN05421736_101468 [Evansella caseinilytica]